MLRKCSSLVLFGAVTALSLLFPGAPDASAIGTVNKKCTYYDTATGYSSRSNGGFTTNGGVCGTAKVRLIFNTHPGSPTYYTGWVYSTTTAVVSGPTSGVIGGNHGVSNPGGAYTDAEYFTS